MNKPAKTSEPIHELLAERWSPRAFDPAVQISAAQMRSLAEAARWAPSCYGDEPWSYVLCNRHSDPEGFERAKNCLVEFNQAWAGNSSLLIIAVAKQNFRTRDGANQHGMYDTGAASMALVLQAEALGLRAHQMGGFDPVKAKTDFQIPDGWDCIAVIAVGRQLPTDTLSSDVRENEEAERTRLELDECFFTGLWGTGLKDS